MSQQSVPIISNLNIIPYVGNVEYFVVMNLRTLSYVKIMNASTGYTAISIKKIALLPISHDGCVCEKFVAHLGWPRTMISRVCVP